VTERVRAALTAIVPPLLLLAAGVVVWETAVTALDIKPFLLPGPRRVGAAIVQNASALLSGMSYTGAAALLGFGLSLLAGMLVGIVFSQSWWLRTAGYPYAIFLQTVPIIAIAPLIVHWCGRGFPSIVVTAFILSLFPIIASATAGLTRIDADLLDLFRLHRASRWQTLWKLRLPASVPAICVGAKTSSGLAIVGAIVGEFFAGFSGGGSGLGYLILAATDQLRMAELFASVLAATGLGVLGFASVSLLTGRILRHWYDAASD
jgi:NitT/TauT family transport system permease protein